MSRWTKIWSLFLVTLMTSSVAMWAQEAAAGGEAAPVVRKTGGMYNMIFGQGVGDMLAWFAMIFTSMAVVALIVEDRKSTR